ncbi:FAD-binding oxidoreductase [Brachybacterium huguangmaarense]|uniref:FAD-binding oxidoreductase n=1 Tax=Brachybacterium huguangmaarense TaxID=1652028 RepID=A0ABY6G528_9MICO|nr:FAD-binding oxidoreductase [Brachybacterium huguangmaarense]UYG17891.1 FAD-binding oxidoreductase [Brachybacterium huguangmaarense]
MTTAATPGSAREVKRHKWWGWGLDDVTFRWDNKPAFAPFAYDKIGIDLPSLPPAVEPQLSDFEVPASILPGDVRARLVEVLGEDNVATDDEYRVVHSFGRSVRDLYRVRTGDFVRLVDAVVYPGTEEEVQRVLEIVLDADLVLIPYGGGSCISGSVTPDVDEKRPVVTLNLGRMRRVLSIDDTAGLAVVEAGVYGPDLEEQLNADGWTLGHFPDSFAYSTLGGWTATRSTGMQSDKYGDIADIVRGLHLVHPRGVLRIKGLPSQSTGPSLREIVVGSEGRLGVITQVTVQVHRLAPERQVIAYMFPDWEHGIRTMHAITRNTDIHTTFARLSDGDETAFSLSMLKEPTTLKSKVTATVQDKLFAYLASKGWDTERGMCIGYVCFEGSKEAVARQQGVVKKIVKANDGVSLGAGAGKIYDQKKFDTPYLRDFLLDYGVFGDVSETAAPWSRLNEVHAEVTAAVHRALDEIGRPGFVFCHMSHSYHSGACLYFTFAFPFTDDDRALAEYDTVKRTMQQAFIDHGATLSHHHAVGTEHQPWMEQDVTAVGVSILQDLFTTSDPGRNLNPGKIVTP